MLKQWVKDAGAFLTGLMVGLLLGLCAIVIAAGATLSVCFG